MSAGGSRSRGSATPPNMVGNLRRAAAGMSYARAGVYGGAHTSHRSVAVATGGAYTLCICRLKGREAEAPFRPIREDFRSGTNCLHHPQCSGEDAPPVPPVPVARPAFWLGEL